MICSSTAKSSLLWRKPGSGGQPKITTRNTLRKPAWELAMWTTHRFKVLSKKNLALIVMALAIVGTGYAAARPKAPFVQTSPKVEAAMIPDTCEQTSNITYGCYKVELTNITKQQGPEKAFALVKQQ